MRGPCIDLFPGVFLLLISFSFFSFPFFFFIFVDSYNDIFQNGAEAGKDYATCYRHENAIEEWLNSSCCVGDRK